MLAMIKRSQDQKEANPKALVGLPQVVQDRIPILQARHVTDVRNPILRSMRRAVQQNPKCNHCSQTGHYAKCCRKTGNFPSKNKNSTDKKKVHIAGAVGEDENWDENKRQKVQNHMLSTVKGRKGSQTG